MRPTIMLSWANSSASEVKGLADLGPEASVGDGADRAVLVLQGRHADVGICSERLSNVRSISGGFDV